MPLDQSEVVGHVREYHAWVARNGADPEPVHLSKVEPRGAKFLAGAIVHSILALLHKLLSALQLHYLAGQVARLRITTDSLSFEPMQCGLNNAYTNLGVAYLRRGHIDAAIGCLEQAWRVYPCPHNTSFGLRMKLCRALKLYPQAHEAIERYKAMNKEFVAQQALPADRPRPAGSAGR